MALPLLLGLALPIAAQTPGVIHVESRLVEVSVSVVDTHGHHVPGLTREDFVVLDQGQPQTIASFTNLEAASGGAPPVAAGTPGVWTNRSTASAAAAPPVTVFLLDQLNAGAPDQTEVSRVLRQFLAKGPPGGAVALYLLSDRLSQLIDLTYDRQALLAAAAGFSPAENGIHTSSALPPSRNGLIFDQMENLVRSKVSAFDMPQRRVRLTEGALTALAERLGRIPGAKNLIWISGGCPLGAGPAYRLSAANVAVYPVDAHGVADVDVRTEDYLPPSIGQLVEPGSDYHDPAESTLFPRDPGFVAKMGALAELTGGAALTGSNDLLSRLRKSVVDGRADYSLGFRPDPARWDGKFHALQVKVKRSGLNVRARAGYLALDELPDAAEQLRLASESPLDATAVPLDVAVTRAPPPGAAIVTTRAQVPGAAIAFEEAEQGSHVARLKLVFVQFAAGGRAIGSSQRLLTISLAGAKYENARRKALRFTTPVAVQDGALRLRILLQDASTGAIGSVTVPLNETFPVPPR